VPEIFTLTAVHCLLQCNDVSHYQVEKARETTHQTSLGYEFYAGVFETERKRVKLLAQFSLYQIASSPPR
jgi:hypothetical protein